MERDNFWLSSGRLVGPSRILMLQYRTGATFDHHCQGGGKGVEGERTYRVIIA